MNLSIWQGDRRIATADKFTTYKPRNIWRGIKDLEFFHFASLQLDPPVLFEHLNGTGLMSLLDHSEIHGDVEVRGLRYVHGRSEIMRGVPSISAVLLARIEPDDQFDELYFRSQLPEMYRVYLSR